MQIIFSTSRNCICVKLWNKTRQSRRKINGSLSWAMILTLWTEILRLVNYLFSHYFLTLNLFILIISMHSMSISVYDILCTYRCVSFIARAMVNKYTCIQNTKYVHILTQDHNVRIHATLLWKWYIFCTKVNELEESIC